MIMILYFLVFLFFLGKLEGKSSAVPILTALDDLICSIVFSGIV